MSLKFVISMMVGISAVISMCSIEVEGTRLIDSRILKEDADSGFKDVKPTEYQPLLFHFHGNRRSVVVKAIPRCIILLDNTDVYILDLGLKLIQWNGSGSNKHEKMMAMLYLNDFASERGGECQTEILDEDSDVNNEFFDALNEYKDDGNTTDNTKEFYRILKANGYSGFSDVKHTEYQPRLIHFHGDLKGVVVKEIPRCRSLLDNTDVYIMDLGLKLFQWNGSGSNKDEKMMAFLYYKELASERGGKCQIDILDEDPYNVNKSRFPPPSNVIPPQTNVTSTAIPRPIGQDESALRKQKEYDWKDSNLTLFSSDTEVQVKKKSADQEAAWKNAGQKCGLQIWRIVNWKVIAWPEEDYGKLFDGDSYIILNTYKRKMSQDLLYDVHFWIGKYSTQDEYGTAAYKTVELDIYLDDKPVQHREVQGHESKLFKSYFESITILKGGADSGFRYVKPKEYQPRLLHFHGDRRYVVVKEIPRCRDLLDNTDVYILDLGLKLYQWNGSGSNKDERMMALRYLKNLQAERGGKCVTETLDEDPRYRNNEFYGSLTEDDDDTEEAEATDTTKELYRLSDASGNMEMTLEKSGQIEKTDLDSQDVFIFDTKDSVFVWIGTDTTDQEKHNAMVYAHNYLKETDHPLVPICCLLENTFCKAFEMAFAA